MSGGVLSLRLNHSGLPFTALFLRLTPCLHSSYNFFFPLTIHTTHQEPSNALIYNYFNFSFFFNLNDLSEFNLFALKVVCSNKVFSHDKIQFIIKQIITTSYFKEIINT